MRKISNDKIEIFPIWPKSIVEVNLESVVSLYLDSETHFTWLKFHNGDIEHVCLGLIKREDLEDFEREISYKFIFE